MNQKTACTLKTTKKERFSQIEKKKNERREKIPLVCSHFMDHASAEWFVKWELGDGIERLTLSLSPSLSNVLSLSLFPTHPQRCRRQECDIPLGLSLEAYRRESTGKSGLTAAYHWTQSSSTMSNSELWTFGSELKLLNAILFPVGDKDGLLGVGVQSLSWKHVRFLNGQRIRVMPQKISSSKK